MEINTSVDHLYKLYDYLWNTFIRGILWIIICELWIYLRCIILLYILFIQTFPLNSTLPPSLAV